MDILSHSLSGVAAVSTFLPFTDYDKKQKTIALLLGALIGAAPDIDAVSLWSKFGSAGHDIYFGKSWYSHHGFNHSIVAALLWVFGVLYFRTKRLQAVSKNEILLSSALFIGFIAHLLEDMPTPYCVWGGVRLFFPFTTYIGGSGKIWWWNNYDIFLLILLITCSNLLIDKIIKSQKEMFILLNTACIVFVIFFQINSRQYDYNYVNFASNYDELETHSKEEQKRILGPSLYNVMETFDRMLPLNF